MGKQKGKCKHFAYILVYQKPTEENANARDEIYSKEQFDKLLDNEHCSLYLKGILATGFFTGMRKGEILNLTWNKVDLKKRRIRLEAIDTKTGEPRTCPICDELYRVLKGIPRAIHDPHVFLYEGKPIKDIKTVFKTLCEKAGVGKETIKAITGHNTDSMFTRYNKLNA